MAGSLAATELGNEHVKAAFVAIALAAVSVLAEETAIEVPQGTGQFPTIGQVACLEEAGGSLCAATYECADGATGELWGDMETHDGRAGIGASSPVSAGRGCVIAVDGKASVKWFTGHSADGVLVGIAPNHAALRPIQRIQRTGGRGGNLFEYILEATDTTLSEIVDEQCGHIREGHPEHVGCVRRELEYAMRITQLESNAATRCLFDVEWNTHKSSGTRPRYTSTLLDWAGKQGPLPDDSDEADPDNIRQCFDQVQDVTRRYGMEWYNAFGCDDGSSWRCSWTLRIIE